MELTQLLCTILLAILPVFGQTDNDIAQRCRDSGCEWDGSRCDCSERDAQRQAECEKDDTKIWIRGECKSIAQATCEQKGCTWDGTDCKCDGKGTDRYLLSSRSDRTSSPRTLAVRRLLRDPLRAWNRREATTFPLRPSRHTQ